MGVKQAETTTGKQIGTMKIVKVEYRPIMTEQYGAQTVGQALDEYLAQAANSSDYVEKITLDLCQPRG